MFKSEIKYLDDIQGMELEGIPSERATILESLKVSLPAASELVSKSARAARFSPISVAATAAFQSVAALVTAAAPKCNLGSPPENIEAKVDSFGNIIYRCYHNPPHEWDLTGRRL